MFGIHARLLIVCGVLVAVASASVTGLAVTLSRPPAGAPAPQAQVLTTLAASTSGNTVTVVGVGMGSGAPDTAQLYLGVSSTRPSVHDALAVASTDAGHLLAALHEAGVKDKDIQTTSIWVQTQTNCCPQTTLGYSASTAFAVTVHDIRGATALIAAAVDAVGNDLQINGINLYVADQGPMLKTARANAMADASTKAQDYARISGHHVGGLISVSEVVSYGTGFSCDQCGGKGAGGGGLPVQPGVTSVTVTIAVTFELGV